jgi:N utilization substance protein B
MATVTRRELRETVFALLFETDFHREEQPADIYNLAKENREFVENKYIKATYFGATEKRAVLDAMITKHSKDWKVTRLSHVSRAVLRYGTYELLYSELPVQIALNEAIVLAKKFDDPKARPFVNGVLNGIKNEIELKGKEACVLQYEQAAAESVLPEAGTEDTICEAQDE